MDTKQVAVKQAGDINLEDWSIQRPFACPQNLPSEWQKGTGSKVTTFTLAVNLRPDCAVVLGGMCSLFTADGENIRKQNVTFETTNNFDDWMRSWYPRIDQIHDAVGIPPKAVKRIVYVCEDSLFAGRVAKWSHLPEDDLTVAIKQAHTELGHPALESWLRINGYKGALEVVYTSDLHNEMGTALRAWQRTIEPGYQFPNRHLDRALVNLMYTGLWADVLKLDRDVVIYEPDIHVATFEHTPFDLNYLPRLRTGAENNRCGLPNPRKDSEQLNSEKWFFTTICGLVLALAACQAGEIA